MSSSVEAHNEPIAVEARFTAGGEATPLAFAWRDQRWIINAWGRRWTETQEQHILQCFLVQTTVGGSTFELSYDNTKAAWRLRRTWMRLPSA